MSIFMDKLFDEKRIELGPATSFNMKNNNARQSLFNLSRHKFCTHLLQNRDVLDIGSSDGFCVPLMSDMLKSVVCIDNDKKIVDDNIRRLNAFRNVEFVHADFIKDGIDKKFDGIIALDFIEHIPMEQERTFMENMCRCLNEHGIAIVGTPNITAQRFASKLSKEYHINLKSYETLKELMDKYFHVVLMFGMNDEVVHTGFPDMCHYIMAVGICPK